MVKTLAFAEARAGAIRKVGFEAVSAARATTDAAGGGEVHAVLVGAPGTSPRPRPVSASSAPMSCWSSNTPRLLSTIPKPRRGASRSAAERRLPAGRFQRQRPGA